MKAAHLVLMFVGVGALAAVPVIAWAKARKRAGDPSVELVAAMAVSENGLKADDDAIRAVAEVFWRNAAAAQKTPAEVLAGRGGALAPWPTATKYKALMASSRVAMLADETNAARVVRLVRESRGADNVSRGGTNWTHGSAPFAAWLEKGYAVVASFKVPSRTRPYLWVYRRPG